MAQVASRAQGQDISPSPETDQPPSPPLSTQERIAARVAFFAHCLLSCHSGPKLQHVSCSSSAQCTHILVCSTMIKSLFVSRPSVPFPPPLAPTLAPCRRQFPASASACNFLEQPTRACRSSRYSSNSGRRVCTNGATVRGLHCGAL